MITNLQKIQCNQQTTQNINLTNQTQPIIQQPSAKLTQSNVSIHFPFSTISQQQNQSRINNQIRDIPQQPLCQNNNQPQKNNQQQNITNQSKILQNIPLLKNILEIFYFNFPQKQFTNSNDLNQAKLNLINAAIQLHPKQPELYEERIRIYQKFNPQTVAIDKIIIKDYDFLIQVYENDNQLWYIILQKAKHMAFIQQAEKETNQQSTTISNSISNNASGPKYTIQQVLDLYNQGMKLFEEIAQKTTKAIASCYFTVLPLNRREVILATYLHKAKIYHQYGNQELELRDLDQLIQIFQHLREAHGVQKMSQIIQVAYFNRAIIYKNKKQYDKSIKDLSTLVQESQFSDALKLLQECIQEKLKTQNLNQNPLNNSENKTDKPNCMNQINNQRNNNNDSNNNNEQPDLVNLVHISGDGRANKKSNTDPINSPKIVSDVDVVVNVDKQSITLPKTPLELIQMLPDLLPDTIEEIKDNKLSNTNNVPNSLTKLTYKKRTRSEPTIQTEMQNIKLQKLF